MQFSESLGLIFEKILKLVSHKIFYWEFKNYVNKKTKQNYVKRNHIMTTFVLIIIIDQVHFPAFKQFWTSYHFVHGNDRNFSKQKKTDRMSKFVV